MNERRRVSGWVVSMWVSQWASDTINSNERSDNNSLELVINLSISQQFKREWTNITDLASIHNGQIAKLLTRFKKGKCKEASLENEEQMRFYRWWLTSVGGIGGSLTDVKDDTEDSGLERAEETASVWIKTTTCKEWMPNKGLLVPWYPSHTNTCARHALLPSL